MAIDFDPAKDRINRERRGLSFTAVERFAWARAVLGVSRVQNYDTATRFFALGEIDGVVHTVIFTFEAGGIRVVSLRRSSQRERGRWQASRTHT